MMRVLIARDLAGWPLTEHKQGFILQLSETLKVGITLHHRRLFMASIVTSQFHCRGAILWNKSCRIRLYQPGWVHRRAVQFRTGDREGQAVATHLNRFPRLCQTLSELDYRHFSLEIVRQEWRCTIEPWAASEVICRLPPVRRYLRLERHQRMLLLSSLKMIADALHLFTSGSA